MAPLATRQLRSKAGHPAKAAGARLGELRECEGQHHGTGPDPGGLMGQAPLQDPLLPELAAPHPSTRAMVGCCALPQRQHPTISLVSIVVGNAGTVGVVEIKTF